MVRGIRLQTGEPRLGSRRLTTGFRRHQTRTILVYRKESRLTKKFTQNLIFGSLCGIQDNGKVIEAKPYYEHSGITTYHGDYREVLMRQLLSGWRHRNRRS
jgi:hypothetical protein